MNGLLKLTQMAGYVIGAVAGKGFNIPVDTTLKENPHLRFYS